MRLKQALAPLLCLGIAATAQTAPKPATKARGTAAAKSASGLTVPVTYYKLPNGLKVVLSEDHTAPTAVVAVYYNIGFRIEPKDRTGFAHLFEHLMFEGSENAPKGTFDKLILGNGGVNNGSTRFDFTNYYEIVPANVLETMLWLEADRMGRLHLDEEHLKNQQGVVGNEVKVNVLNQPYGGFPWIDMPMAANTNWYNAHNFYGDLTDIEAATLEDARGFYKTYYAPNNAVVVVVGDFDAAQAKAWIQKYFSPLPSGPAKQAVDLTEPKQEKEKRVAKEDAIAKRPALAIGYHIPKRNTPEYYAFILLDQLLVQGEDSLLRQELVKKRGYTASVEGGMNLLGNQFNFNGPMNWIAYLFHDASVTNAQILEAIDSVVESLRTKPVDASTLELARTKLRSDFYDNLGDSNGLGKADLLASFALFDDNPARINDVEKEIAKVTPQLLQQTAAEYLRPTNRTIVTRVPKAEAAKPAAGGQQ
jgi:predicted Zn-dependent peptidase